MQTVATMSWTLSFDIVLDSMELFHYEVRRVFMNLDSVMTKPEENLGETVLGRN